MTQFREDISVYRIISILGGCFQNRAIVNLAKHVPSDRMLAVKRYQLEKIRDSYLLDLIEKEIILTRQLQHPNIISLHTAFVYGPEIFVISPLQAYGSCKSLINSHFNEGLPELAVILILRDVTEAISYLHKIGFIHRAIRASHILISATGKACLSGLRYACSIVNNGKWQKAIHSFPLTTKSNLNWLSPELLEQNLKGYNEKSDIYSLGMVCCELANGREPFAEVDTTLMLVEKVRGCAPSLLDCNTIFSTSEDRDCDVPVSWSKRRFNSHLHEFCYICLERESSNRPSAAQLLQHPVFKLIKKGASLPELLKPAIPLSDKVAFNGEEMTNVDQIEHFSDMDMSLYDWDFSLDENGEH
ncbi:STE20-related kinase adapter protein alpha isoform X2 [Coccinella septempunctata]|uniref:STE20-related kinase adapter protein alpha isoform X2 n=1 Tax=Coccinella septempunctata TaxID=41139 RepID=UPI001D07AF76|nr:STE20-related kinase adapter protein alpha isoform X2 [Coccinella septempunctata]